LPFARRRPAPGALDCAPLSRAGRRSGREFPLRDLPGCKTPFFRPLGLWSWARRARWWDDEFQMVLLPFQDPQDSCSLVFIRGFCNPDFNHQWTRIDTNRNIGPSSFVSNPWCSLGVKEFPAGGPNSLGQDIAIIVACTCACHRLSHSL